MDSVLRDKLRKIEALYAGAATSGEKAAAADAAERIRAKLQQAEQVEKPIEVQWSIHDPWQRMLFIALCRRYGLRPYRKYRSKRQTVMVRAPKSFMRGVLEPEFYDLAEVLEDHLMEITTKIISAEIFETVVSEADEAVDQQALLFKD